MAFLYFRKMRNRPHSEAMNMNEHKEALTKCTCVETNDVWCSYHDQPLLLLLAKALPSYELMYEIGIRLHVDSDTIDACKEDNRGSVVQAVYQMLYQKWYKNKDGVGRNSNGLKELKQALKDIKKSQLIMKVIQRQLNERDTL